MKLRYALFALMCSPAYAETGYVFAGDLNGDGAPDSIASGPAEMFGNGGGPFVVKLSDGKGGFLLKEIELHP